MILVTGGAFQGKLEFAQSLVTVREPVVIEGENLDSEMIKEAEIVNQFHLYIKKLLQQGQGMDVNSEVNHLILQNPDIIIIVNEMGSGIVPMDAFLRNYRECVGRTCCSLAAKAEEVYRVTCGIGIKIK